MGTESDKADTLEVVTAAGQTSNPEILVQNRRLAEEILVYKTGMYVGIGIAGVLGVTLLVSRIMQSQKIAEAQLRAYQQPQSQPQGYGYPGYGGYPAYGYR